MINKKINSIEFSKRKKSIFLATLYFIILSVTSFHHHPVDLAGESPFYLQHQSESNSYIYTDENCPIINFANNGFNSFGIASYTSTLELVSNFSFFIKSALYFNLEIYPSNYQRGPPSPLFI